LAIASVSYDHANTVGDYRFKLIYRCHSEVTGNDSLLGSNPSYHGTLFSTFSQEDATQHILLVWACLSAIILLLLLTVGLALKAKDVRK